MNHAERVKELAQEFAVAAVVTAIVGRLGDSKPSREEADKKAAELLAAIDEMQSALDDAVAKLAAREAEIARFRGDPARFERLQQVSAAQAWRSKAINAALSEEVKGGE